MADVTPFENTDKSKSFWKRPEGITGTIFLAGLIIGGGYLLFTILPTLLILAQNVLYLALMLIVLAAIIYMVLDPKMRALIGYMYKSIMRKITSIFVTIDPIGILKNYISDLEDNLSKMSKQIGGLRGQMRKLKDIMTQNSKDIQENMKIASKAKELEKDKQMVLHSRKAARLKESNEKYSALYNRMEVLHRILAKMYTNSEILLEDTRDQVKVKEQERKAIRASHGAMKSAMNIISGDKDKRAMFDMALEAVADDVANKVGEMERFMEMSANFMDSVDLQNGVFEEEGIKMLEQWEKQSTLMLLGDGALKESLDLESPRPEYREKGDDKGNSYDNMFD